MTLSLYPELKHRAIKYVIGPAKAARSDPTRTSSFKLRTLLFIIRHRHESSYIGHPIKISENLLHYYSVGFIILPFDVSYILPHPIIAVIEGHFLWRKI